MITEISLPNLTVVSEWHSFWVWVSSNHWPELISLYHVLLGYWDLIGWKVQTVECRSSSSQFNHSSVLIYTCTIANTETCFNLSVQANNHDISRIIHGWVVQNCTCLKMLWIAEGFSLLQVIQCYNSRRYFASSYQFLCQVPM